MNDESIEEKLSTGHLFILSNENLSIIKASPFTCHYERLDSEMSNLAETSESGPVNKYYKPNLMNIIKKRLHIMPFWSFVIANDLNQTEEVKVNRLTNNPVEGYFNILKHQV